MCRKSFIQKFENHFHIDQSNFNLTFINLSQKKPGHRDALRLIHELKFNHIIFEFNFVNPILYLGILSQ